ncbi:MAG: YgiQ family radical SAM protein [Candidatus Aminicenantes bacterium]|nr:YgiQ family radical SAM protein [Candidatus Aminicenantes bacterium]
MFDVILVLPYPFSDHPSFPEAILKRALEAGGFTVGVIETPFWQDKRSFTALGRPVLFFAVVSGPLDSVVLNYTSSRRRRREDLYQFDGQAFFAGRPPSIKFKIRPDRTLTVFCSRIRESYRDVPLVIGGVEATQRCFAHYDFQENKVRRSILIDSRADILVSGNGEKQIVAIARLLRQGGSAAQIDIPGTARVCSQLPLAKDCLELPACEAVQADAGQLLQSQVRIGIAGGRRALAQKHANRWVVQNPSELYESDDLDHIFGLGYSRRHLKSAAYSPALRMNLFSVTAHRGCAGGCAFCSITLSEGRRVVSRSVESILEEIRSLAAHPEWHGVVSDIGGATAEMYGSDCRDASCRRDSCLQPRVCRHFNPGEPYRQLLCRSRALPGVKKVMLGSGVRHDLLLQNPDLLAVIMGEHCGRFLRVAPEHSEDEVLALMGKPGFSVFEEFVALFKRLNRSLPRPIELAPYLIVGHPGETPAMVQNMKKKMNALGLKTCDVQIFTPTPGTLSTAMYHAGLSPSGKEIFVEKDIRVLQQRKHSLTAD